MQIHGRNYTKAGLQVDLTSNVGQSKSPPLPKSLDQHGLSL